MKIAPLNDTNRIEVDRHIRETWGGPMIVTLGNLYDSSLLPGYVALDGKEIAGAVLYRVADDDCEIATLFSLRQNQGVGRLLINQVIEAARKRHCHRVWLITTNDNTHAIRYYQKFGFALKAVHIGGFERTRRLKRGLPDRGIDGIPIAHEFEFEILLTSKQE